MDKQNKINQVSIGFNEKWNNVHLGIDYSEDAWSDPIRRTEIQRETQRMIYDRFGDVGLGSRDPKPMPHLMAYGHRFMSALFGCEIKYIKDQAPCAIQRNADFDEMAKFSVPDFEKSPVIRRAFEEAEVLKKHYGYCSADVVAGSPLNVAVSVFGEPFLIAIALEPEIAKHVLMVIAETELRLYKEFENVLEPEKFPKENILFPYGNCPAIMVSPHMYEEVVLPVDMWVRNQVSGFHLHHCGTFDKYIDLYTRIKPTSIDVGGGSDYLAIRKAFPVIPMSMIINPSDFEGKSNSEIDELIGSMVERAAPYDKITGLWTADFSAETPDENIRALATVHERI